MDPATLTAILGVIRVGGAIAQGFIKDEEVKQYIDLGVSAMQGSETHIVAQSTIEQWLSTGYSPTREELDAVLKEAGVAHAGVQGAAADFLKGLGNGKPA